MGDSKGHFTNGIAFCILGIWHLFNHIKLHARNPKSYTSLQWFPTPKIRHLELFFIMAASSTSAAMELFTASLRHLPLDSDGSISASHLPHLEHSIIASAIFAYALFSFLLDKSTPPPIQHDIANFLAAVAFAAELLLFRLHSADHMGLEGHYHRLLQVVISAALGTTLLSVKYPKSFVIGFFRSLSLFFHGVWFIAIGFMLWTPALIPNGCSMIMDQRRSYVVRCGGDGDLRRAKSLATILFSNCTVGLTAAAVAFYLVVVRLCSDKVESQSLTALHGGGGDEVEVGDDVSLLQMGRSFVAMDVELQDEI